MWASNHLVVCHMGLGQVFFRKPPPCDTDWFQGKGSFHQSLLHNQGGMVTFDCMLGVLHAGATKVVWDFL